MRKLNPCDREDDDVVRVAAERRTKLGGHSNGPGDSHCKSHMLCFSNNSVLQPTAPTTGSGGRSGAAEKLVKEERLSSFHGSSLLIG